MMRKTCAKCEQTKPLDGFRAHPRAKDGRLNTCLACQRKAYRETVAKGGQKRSYIDRDASEAQPELSSEDMIRFWRMSSADVRVAETCVERVRAHARHAGRVKGRGEQWDGESASELVNRLLPHASTKRRVRILQVALARAWEDGVDLRTRREATWYDKIPTEDLLDEIRTLALELGHTPRQQDVREFSQYSLKAYRSRFGTWAEACEAAGLVPNEQGRSGTQPLPEGLREEAA